jgi:uroporphyrin-III C-methyltransferase / precorrin-2 dehydrogenase / sirohydrochlorin ferrochelatase
MTTDHRRSWRHPIFLDLDGQPVVVIGGGTVAERKIETLLDSGARVTVVSPEVTARIATRSEEGRVTLRPRRYQAGDLRGFRLAYAATSDPDVNLAVRREALDSAIWLNAIDQPDLCDFITPAIVRRGDLTIAVSTNGRCPALARRLREDLERQYGPEYAEKVEHLARIRDRDKAETDSAAPPRGPAVGRVYLVGAGPGDPELVTLKGRRLLACADTVVYDALVDQRLLDVCRPSASRVYVGKRSGCHSRSQGEINALLIDEARAGHVVVRLKGGDPFMFGRGGEEAKALIDAGISFEVVPGVSAGTAVPAYAGIPLTHRDVTDEVVFLSGHDSPTSPWPVDWARYASSPATLVVFMGLSNLGAISRALIEHGRDARCPAAVISHGATAAQRVVVAPLEEVAEKVAEAGIEAPALIVIGEVVNVRATPECPVVPRSA